MSKAFLGHLFGGPFRALVAIEDWVEYNTDEPIPSSGDEKSVHEMPVDYWARRYQEEPVGTWTCLAKDISCPSGESGF